MFFKSFVNLQENTRAGDAFIRSATLLKKDSSKIFQQNFPVNFAKSLRTPNEQTPPGNRIWKCHKKWSEGAS